MGREVELSLLTFTGAQESQGCIHNRGYFIREIIYCLDTDILRPL
jgi:hypothetical protein